MRQHKTIAECLADEIINCEKANQQSSYALKKKEEIEKVAKGNRWSVLSYMDDIFIVLIFIIFNLLDFFIRGNKCIFIYNFV